MTASPWRNAAMLAPALLATILLFGGALAGAVEQSFTPPLGGGFDTWSLQNWQTVLGDPVFGEAMLFSLRTAFFATVLSAAIALGIAYLLRSHGSATRTAAAFPVPVPHLIVAVVAVLWLAPGGLADRLLGSLPINFVRDQAGLGVVLVYLFKETPFLVVLLMSVMGRRMQEREEMAAVYGMGVVARLKWIVWPTVRTPLAVGSLIVAAYVFSAFEVPLTVGPNYPPSLGTYALEVTQSGAIEGAGEAAAALLLGALASIALALAILGLISRRWPTSD